MQHQKTIMKYKLLFPAFLLFISFSAFSQTTASADTVSVDDVIFTKAENEASFPGGEAGWTAYIRQHIERNIDALVKANKSGTCRLKFIVDKNGNVRDVEALTMKGTRLAKVSIAAILSGPKWIPAMQNGRAVNAYREQPVTFTIQ
jgi:protein TonB